MISIPVYLRLWRLYASNQHLLKMYYFLYYSAEGEEASFYKREFDNRIGHRENIKQELQACLEEGAKFQEGSRSLKIIKICFPVIFSMDHNLYDILFKTDLDRCKTYEIKNIEMYYEILYAGSENEELTNMLLEQKSVIENSVFREI